MSCRITWRREASRTRGASSAWSRWTQRRRQDREDEQRASTLAARFAATVANLGLARDTESCAGLPGIDSPQVTHVVLGDEVERLTVRMLPGQLVREYQQHAAELAEGLGVRSVSFHWRAHGTVIAELRRVDPLDTAVGLPEFARGRAGSVLVGRLDNGHPLVLELAGLAHIIVQGQTRSGKSRWAYGYLSQLAGCSDVHISGSDVSGVLLRPFQHTQHGDLLALGTSDVYRHAEVLETLVSRMDDRLGRIPDDSDVLEASEHDPYEVVVVEELPGLMRAASAEDDKHKGEKGRVPVASRIQAAYGRLLAEGAKVGFRLLIVMQRADANIVGGFERGQCTLRLTFSVADPSSVKMLHASVNDEQAHAHTVAAAARALVSGPGIPVAGLRAPEMGAYADFRANVVDASAAPPAVVDEEPLVSVDA